MIPGLLGGAKEKVVKQRLKEIGYSENFDIEIVNSKDTAKREKYVKYLFQKLQREGEEGRRKITQLTRYGTVVITAFQAIAFSINLIATAPQAIVVNEFAFTLTAMIVLTAGTVFVMWLGERITDRGIGNGISLIIMIGIIAILPANFYNEVTTKSNLILVIIELAALIVVIAAVVMLTQGVRKIPVQYAKRVVGRKVYGGTTQYLPLKVNAAGVMPIIFAQSIMFIPSTIGQFFPENETVQFLTAWSADFTGWTYSIIFFFICSLGFSQQSASSSADIDGFKQ